MADQGYPFSIRRRLRSFRFAFKGIAFAFRTQHNLWIHLVAGVVAVGTGILLHISRTEWLFIVFAIGFVITSELFNTAIEHFVDLASPEWNEKAGRIKDVAAGAVLIAAITALVTGLVIFAPKVLCFN
jgi:diacylglycerol kinase (ATP)